MDGIYRLATTLQCRRRPALAAIRLHNRLTSSTRYLSSPILLSTRYSSSSNTDPLSPSDAGMLAYEMRRTIEANNKSHQLSMATHLSHAGLSPSNNSSNNKSINLPLSPPIDLATTYERPPNGDYGEDGMIYSRSAIQPESY